MEGSNEKKDSLCRRESQPQKRVQSEDKWNGPSTAAMTTLSIAVSVAVVMLRARAISMRLGSWSKMNSGRTVYIFLVLLTDRPFVQVLQIAVWSNPVLPERPLIPLQSPERTTMRAGTRQRRRPRTYREEVLDVWIRYLSLEKVILI